jgi:hypothetical protein
VLQRLGIILVWAVNILGSADLLYAFYQGNRIGFAPGQQGAAYFIPTVLVPLLLITHGLMFRLLLKRDGEETGRARAYVLVIGPQQRQGPALDQERIIFDLETGDKTRFERMKTGAK